MPAISSGGVRETDMAEDNHILEAAERTKYQLMNKAEEDREKQALERRRKELQDINDRERAARESKERMERESSSEFKANARKQEREAAARQKAALREEESRKKEAAGKIEREQKIADAARRARERQEDAEATKQLKAMTAKNEAAIREREREQAALNSAKTSSERIRLRQQIEEKRRVESQQKEAENARRQYPSGMRPITPGTIKDSIKKAVSKAPALADRVITRGGETIIGALGTNQVRNPNKIYKEETRLLSKALKPHAKKPITGGPVPYVQSGGIAINPNFMDALVGRAPLQTQTARTTGGAKKKNVVAVGGVLSRLDAFARGL